MFTRTIQQRHNIGCHAVYNCALYYIQIISHDEIHYREPISFSGNALKPTYGKVELKNVSGVTPPDPRFRDGGKKYVYGLQPPQPQIPGYVPV